MNKFENSLYLGAFHAALDRTNSVSMASDAAEQAVGRYRYALPPTPWGRLMAWLAGRP